MTRALVNRAVADVRKRRDGNRVLAVALPAAANVSRDARLQTRSRTDAHVDRLRLADPSAMGPAARIAELGQILAIGFRRLRVSLDGSRVVERECSSMEDANNAEATR